MSNPFITNLATTETTLGGGYAPPEGSYKMEVKEVTFGQNSNGSHHMKVSVTTVDGEHTGSGLFMRFNFPTGDAKKDGIKFILLAMLAKAVGIPENAMASLNWQEAGPQLVGRNLVVYVEDRGTYTGNDGSERRSYEGVPVPLDNAEAALAGTWTPRGGRKPQAQSALPFNPQATPAAQTAPPQNGGTTGPGFNGLFDQMV